MIRSARSHAFSWFTALLVTLLASLQGCDCGGTDVNVLRFPCTRDDECASGYLCRAGECQPEGEPVEGPDGGPDGGKPDAGGDAGTPDGGGTDGGPTGDTDGGTDGGSNGGTDGGTDGGTSNLPTSITFITSSQTVLAGACSGLVELEARDASSKPTPFSNTQATSAALTVQPDPGLWLFSDPGCTTPIANAVFAPGATRAGLYFKGQTGGSFTVFASVTGLPTTRYFTTVLPAVRTDNCLLANGSSSVTCPISPPQTDISKTLLIFQTTSNNNSPNTTSVRCTLTAVNSITCSRSGTSGAIGIQWQTAELPSGLKVQHLQADCGGAAFIEFPITPVSAPDETFLLVSSQKGGTDLDEDELFTATLQPEGDHLHLEFGTVCSSTWTASVQIVEFNGTDVTRGETGAMTGAQLVVSGLPPVDLSSTALLFTHRLSDVSGSGTCDRLLRGELTSPTSITFSRAAGNTSCTFDSIDAISWERIEFGARARAQHFLVTMPANATTTSVPILGVDRTRTLAFASGQAVSGQAGGESSYTADDIIGGVTAIHSLVTPTDLQLTRGAATGTARWSSTVLQLEP